MRLALEETGIRGGGDIVSLSDIPAYKTGLGLGSSSSFTVGLLNCLYNFLGKNYLADVLAKKAGIEFDKWTSEEKDIHKKKLAEKALDVFKKKSLTWQKPNRLEIKKLELK